METLKHFIGGEFVQSLGNETLPLTNPANGQFLAEVPIGSDNDVDRAVCAAAHAFETWRLVPASDRARLLFRYKSLLDTHAEKLAQIVTKEHGKALCESRGSVKRGIENVEHACGIPTLMQGESLEDISKGIDTSTFRQPLGVCAAVTPYNFPAMVPMWFWPYALMTGNTFVLKPSEKVPLSSEFQMRLIKEAGFPDGVINLVHGSKEAVTSLIDHKTTQAISFVGSTPVARLVYEKAAKNGKRVQAFGGAKNHVVMMPDCAAEQSIAAVVESAFGCAGQRCLAASVVILVGDAYERLLPQLVSAAQSLRIGDGLDSSTNLGPLISSDHLQRVRGFLDQGERDGAQILLDGRTADLAHLKNGHFIGPSILTPLPQLFSLNLS